MPLQARTYSECDYGIPKEKVCVPQEVRFKYAYCTSGSPQALESLLRLYESSMEESQDLSMSVCEAILQNITFADILGTYYNPGIFDKL